MPRVIAWSRIERLGEASQTAQPGIGFRSLMQVYLRHYRKYTCICGKLQAKMHN